jgi:hypothetical protein
MLTKLGLMALTATIGTTALTSTASADEHNYNYNHDNQGRYDARVDGRFGVREGVAMRDGIGVREDAWARRRAYERMQRERRERAMMHARWLRMHNGGGYRGW